MNRNAILFFLLIILLTSLGVDGAALKLVKTIGSDDADNYLFMRISGAVLSDNKDVYIIDGKGHFLARYDWNGKFIKKVGQRGQGPNDFNRPVGLDILDDKLYLYDSFNARVAVVDRELKKIDYIKLPTDTFTDDNFFVIGKQRFVNSCFPNDINKEYGLVKVTSLTPFSENTFFENTSFKVNHKNPRVSLFLLYSKPVIGIDRKNRNIIISHRYPNEPIEFYTYSFEGECQNSFSISFDKGYSLPSFLRKGESPMSYEALMVLSIFAHKEHYIVMAAKYIIEKRKPVYSKCSKYCLVIDPKTKELKHRFDVPIHFQGLSISEDGYLLAAKYFEEIPKLYIYKLDL